MIFLLEYDRDAGELFHIQSFEDGDRDIAVSARLELEIELLREKLSREVVLLEAENLDALRATHSRYFRSASELAEVGGSRIGSIEMEDAAKVRVRLNKERLAKEKLVGSRSNQRKRSSGRKGRTPSRGKGKKR